MKKKNFAIIGLAGYIAKKHAQTIKALKHHLKYGCDIHDNVGYIDKFFPNCLFFKSEKEFWKKIRKDTSVDYVVICTPNYLHFEHIKKSIRYKKNVICEKPLVRNIQELKKLKIIQNKSNKKIFTILQLRYDKIITKIISYHNARDEYKKKKYTLEYITPRGEWYENSWKQNHHKSGGLAMNIGIHLFDILVYLFGEVVKVQKIIKTKTSVKGTLLFNKNTEINFYLSINKKYFKHKNIPKRILKSEDKIFNLSSSFTNLHINCYKEILFGRGFGINDIEKSFKLTKSIK